MKKTVKPHLPTYRDFMAYLQGLGFTTTDRYEYGVICRHAETDCWLAYQDRKPPDPILHTGTAFRTPPPHRPWDHRRRAFDEFLTSFRTAKAG